MDQNAKDFHCSFCKRKKNEVKKLIAGKNSKGVVSFICDVCTEICYTALKKNSKQKNNKINKMTSLTPQKIYDELCKYVKSQDEAKKSLSVAAYNHYKRIINPNLHIDKSNIMLVGKSGSGKTLLVETLSNILNVPFVSVDVTAMTEAGYIGEDVNSCIEKLLQEAKFDVELAETGIVFLDEVDKLKRKGSEDGNQDISGVGVQQSLLKLIEGTNITINTNAKKGYGQESVVVNTKNILFICAGAFEGLIKIIEKDENVNIGFMSEDKIKSKYSTLMSKMNSTHLVKYGMIQELVGRLPIRLVLEELTKNDLVDILINTENSIINQYKNLLFLTDNTSLSFTKNALEAIADRAIKSSSGARSLKAIIEKILLDIMFKLPSLEKNSKVIINKNVVEGKILAKIQLNQVEKKYLKKK